MQRAEIKQRTDDSLKANEFALERSNRLTRSAR